MSETTTPLATDEDKLKAEQSLREAGGRGVAVATVARPGVAPAPRPQLVIEREGRFPRLGSPALRRGRRTPTRST